MPSAGSWDNGCGAMGAAANEQNAGVSRRDAWVSHQFAADALRRVIDVFTGEGIEVLPVKGIVLAHTLYESVADRPIADVDLRILPRDLRRAGRAAVREGWRVWINSRQLGSRGLDVSGTLVEIESTIGPPGVCAVGVDRFLARSRVTSAGLGFEHREPELHDHALLLCLNAFKDKLVRAQPWALRDLERIVAVRGFQPEVLALRAGEARLRTMVWAVADWLVGVRHLALWREVLSALGAPPHPAYARLYRSLLESAPDSRTLSLVARAASDSWWMRGAAVALGIAGTARAELAPGLYPK